MVEIKRALISVFDKTNIVELARSLTDLGVEIISSGGTANLLTKSGIKVTEVSDFTGFPEMMNGRVKTLHPKIHGGILADRSKEKHLEEAKANDIGLIDLVVVNLYPFEETVLQAKDQVDKAIENIDIGGPTLVRAAAKNYKSVAVIVNPEKYEECITQIKQNKEISQEFRDKLALEAWEHIAHYDAVIENYFRNQMDQEKEFPQFLNMSLRKKQDLRYGENPHQQAALYVNDHNREPSIMTSFQLQGKQLSYNNILDGNAALELLKEFGEPTAVVVKHNNPSGVASNPDIVQAFISARGVDPEAAFGGVIALNKEVDENLAKEITSKFVEIVIAPNFTKEAQEIFSKKKNVRLLVVEQIDKKRKPYREYRSVVGGLLTQDGNVILHDQKFNIVTKRQPTDEEILAMKYAWKVCKHVKSNSIVYARKDRVVGIGAGQMKRVNAAKLAADIASDFNLDIKGCAMASDAFFPFRDGIDAAAKRGITAVIQPGGSIRDKEVIDAADEHGMSMVFTGVRHFRH
jgi:phosphoribosylaminoimidazolecarboxamide formyltransferase/IMP cyclohydrolase